MPSPPQSKTFTADNISGSNITIIADGTTRVLIGENNDPTIPFTLTLQAGTACFKGTGSQVEITALPGTSFRATQVVGKLIASAGTMSFSHEEY